MTKSIRSKVKMAARRKKRENGNYAAADAARVARLSAKLLGTDSNVIGKAKADDGDEVMDDEIVECDTFMLTEPEPTKNVSTSAPRETRREQWRESKGMSSRPKKNPMNRQGLMIGRSKAGKNKRRR